MSTFTAIFSNSAFYNRPGNSIWGILIVANISLEILLKSWQKCTAVVFWLLSPVWENLKIKSQCGNIKSDQSSKMCKVCGSGHQVEEKTSVLVRPQVSNPSKFGLDSQLLWINLLNLSFLLWRKRTNSWRVAKLMTDDAYKCVMPSRCSA